MYFSKSLFVSSLLAAAIAAPAPAADEKVSFKVGRPGLRKPKNGRQELEKAFRKFGFQMIGHDAQEAVNNAAIGNIEAAAGNSTGNDVGTVQANPTNNDAEFLENVKVGGKSFSMDFDSGSSDMWLFSTELSQKQIGQHTAFNPNTSADFKAIDGATFDISYGDGSAASGTVGSVSVNVGGASVTDQALGVTTSVSASFVQDAQNDGLMGLAFNKINTVKKNGQKAPQKTFFFNAINKLKQPVFAADLEADNSGTYEFGNIDQKAFKGDLKDVKVDSSNGFWQFDSKKFTIDGKATDNAKASPAIADTGTSLMLVDQNVATAYYKNVQGAQFVAKAGGFVYPCNAKLPDFGVATGDNNVASIPGDQITFAKLNQKVCLGGIQSNAGSGLQIYGDTFFKAQYVVFDGANTKLQIAPKPTNNAK